MATPGYGRIAKGNKGMSDVEIVRLSDITPDDRNANRHTERGEYAIRRSLEKFGFAEAGTLDANNKLISGNLRTEAAHDVLDADDAIVIDVDGKKPVYIRRRDIDLDTAAGRELAVALNRVPQLSIDWSPDVLLQDIDAGVDLGDWFQGWELEALFRPDNDEWGDAFGKLPNEDRAPFQQMTFTLHDEQVEQVKAAITAAKALGPFVDAPNENSNGNALARVCELFLMQHGQG